MQDRAVSVLSRLLKPQGTLFVASAETRLVSRHGFVSSGPARSFAFRRTAARTTAFRGMSVPAPERPAVGEPLPSTVRALPLPESRPRQGLTPAADQPGALDTAARLADLGQVAEAGALCEEHLRRAGPSARVFYLLGLVREATSQHEDAASYYRKALYLDPSHSEALFQLALLMEKGGDAAAAQVLRDRARRLEQRPGKAQA
jgi:chemotaxis protein methyltransferase WspC